jgi:hypothetical protein
MTPTTKDQAWPGEREVTIVLPSFSAGWVNKYTGTHGEPRRHAALKTGVKAYTRCV